MTDTSTGGFVWYELMTTDPEAAIPFYTSVVGWTTQAFGEGSDYTMWASSQGPLGGVAKLAAEAGKVGAGAPPHWMAHVKVPDVDASVAQARRLDAKVYVEPTDIPTVGRFAVIADPQGASISVFKPGSGSMTAHDSSKPGELSWNELGTTDVEAGFRFYHALFGWERLLDHDMGPMGTYVIFGHHGKQLGGMFTKPKEMKTPSSWLYYVQVGDLDAALERAKKGGARVLNGPMEVPGGARIVQLLDPQGAAFALHENAKPKAA
jgi:predicted enzyme related to lactoylglutathione lyase